MNLTIVLMLVSLTAYAQPSWIHDTQRRVIGGDIIHWGTGQADTSEVALFKARHMAIKAILEECGGFAHKSIVPKQRHVEQHGSGFIAYAKVYIPAIACDYGKQGHQNSGRENQRIVTGQEFYDQLMGNNHHQRYAAAKKVEARIYGWIQKLNDDFYENVKAEHDATQQQLNALKRELELLRGEMDIKRNPIVEAPGRIPSSSAMKQHCWAEYRDINNYVRMKASAYYMNMAHPNVREYFNQAEMKKASCLRLQ